MPLSVDERQAFLAEPHVASLSVAAGADRGPVTVPIWYQYVPGGEAWIVTGKGSRKHELIEKAGRFTLLAHTVSPAMRYVSVEGSVSRIVPMTEEHHREMAARYLPEGLVESYLKAAEAFGDMVTIGLQPEHWLTADTPNIEDM